MDKEVERNLKLIKNKGALVNGLPTSESFNNTDDSLEQISDNIGQPQDRGNFTSIEAMIGVPDSTNSSLDDILRTGQDSSAISANEDGSVEERLEQIQEAVNVGTGTALAANKSLVDALGTNGTTVTDSAVSVLGAIGANSADNSFGSASVVSNPDGSVLERLESLIQATLVRREGAYMLETWQAAIDEGVWTSATGGTGAVTRDVTEEPIQKVVLSGPANADTARLYTVKEWQFDPLAQLARTVKGLYVSWEAKFATVASIENTKFFMGLSSDGAASDRSSNNLTGFFLNSDVLNAIIDDAGSESTATVGGPTLTSWHKFEIRCGTACRTITSDRVELIIDNTLQAAWTTTNVPHMNAALLFYLEQEAAANGGELHIAMPHIVYLMI